MSHREPTQTNAGSEPEGQVPEPEVLPRATRRQFSAAYKLGIVEKAGRCTERWQMGIVLKVSEKAFGTGRLIPITRR